MSYTLDEFILKTRRWLREPTASKSRWLDVDLIQFFNEIYLNRCTELIMAFEGNFTFSGLRDVTANQDKYAWPDNFLKLQKIELVRSDGRRIPMLREERHYNYLPAPFAGGENYDGNIRLISNGFIMEPTPTEEVTDGLRIEFAGMPVELEDGADTIHPDFPAIFQNLLIMDTVMACYDAQGQLESYRGLVRNALRRRNEYEENFERFIETKTVHRQKVQQFRGPYPEL